MEYVKNHNTFGVETKEIPCIVGKGAPSVITNVVGLLYMDEDTGEVYKRTASGWVLLVPQMPDVPNIVVVDTKPADLTPYEIGDIILVKEA